MSQQVKNRSKLEDIQALARRYNLDPKDLAEFLERGPRVEHGTKVHEAWTPKNNPKATPMRMLEINSTLVRPFMLSEKKARAILAVLEDIKAFVG